MMVPRWCPFASVGGPHGQETAQDPHRLPPLPRLHPRQPRRERGTVTGEPSALKDARWVRREAARKRPAPTPGTGPRRAAHPVTGSDEATCDGRKWPVTWVGVAGFEPAASSSRTKRAAKLRHTPPPETAQTPGRAAPGTPGSLADAGNQREQGCLRSA